MNILIECSAQLPVLKYGGTERVVWYLGKSLSELGHQVFFLAKEGSTCDFANVIEMDDSLPMDVQIPECIDVVHFNNIEHPQIQKPYLITRHGNGGINPMDDLLDRNTTFISKDQASRFGSTTFVHNGLDWNDYLLPNLDAPRDYFHFLGKAAWRVKNVNGAIQCVTRTKKEKIHILGGNRLNIKMGFRFTCSPRASFYGMVGNAVKNDQLSRSKGFVFPVLWNEPFGLAIIESLYLGCPVFATPYGAIPELVNKEVGFLSNSSSELTQALENSGEFDRKNCHEYARDHFNSKRMALDYIELYEKVINGEHLNTVAPKLQNQEPKFLEWKA